MRMFDFVHRPNQGFQSSIRVRWKRPGSPRTRHVHFLVAGLLVVATLLSGTASTARADYRTQRESVLGHAKTLASQAPERQLWVAAHGPTIGLSPAEIALVTPFVRGGSHGYRLSANVGRSLPLSLVVRAEQLIAAADRDRRATIRTTAHKPGARARAGWTAYWWGVQVWMDAGVTKKVADALITGGSAFLILGLLWDAGLVTAPIGVLLKVIGALAKAGGYLLRWCSGPRGAVVTRSWLAGMWCVAR